MRAVVPAGAVHEELGRTALATGGPGRPARTWPRRRSTTTSPSSCSSRTSPRCARPTQRAVRCLRDALPLPRPAGRAGGDPVRRRGDRRDPAPARPRPGPHPMVVLIPGLDSAKEEFRPTEELFLEPRPGHLLGRRSRAGRGRVRPARSGRTGRCPARPSSTRSSALPGIDPGRIGIWGVSLGGYYARPGGQRRPPGARLHRAVRAVQLRRHLGSAARADPRGAFRCARSRSAPAQARSARRRAARWPAGASALTAPTADRGRAAGPDLPLAAGARGWPRRPPGPPSCCCSSEGNHGCANVPYQHRPYSADWMARQLSQ